MRLPRATMWHGMAFVAAAALDFALISQKSSRSLGTLALFATMAALLLSLALDGFMVARLARHGLGGAWFFLDQTLLASLVALAAALVWRVRTSSRA